MAKRAPKIHPDYRQSPRLTGAQVSTYRSASIPEFLNARFDDEERATTDITLGWVLNHHATDWLDKSLKGRDREQRLIELQQWRPEYAAAYQAKSSEDAARVLEVSERTARRWRQRARDFMGEADEFPVDGDFDAKMIWLRLNRPELHDTFCLNGAGHGMDTISGFSRVHPDTVTARLRKARKMLGLDAVDTPQWKIVRHPLASPQGYIGDDGDRKDGSQRI